METKVDHIRSLIEKHIPTGTIVPEHTATQHFYRYVPKNELYASVTTKSDALKEDFKNWAVTKCITHIRDNFHRLQSDWDLVLKEAESAHSDVFEDAGKIGTRIHNIIEDYLNDWIAKKKRPSNIMSFVPSTESDSRVISAVRGAERFCKDHHIIPVWSELLVASPSHKVAGTLDFLAYIGVEKKPGDKNCDHELWQVGKHPDGYGCTKCSLKVRYQLALIDWKSSNSITKSKYMMQVATYWECLKELTGLAPKKVIIVGLDKKNADYIHEDISRVKRHKAFTAYSNLIRVYDWYTGDDAKFDGQARVVMKI